MSIDPMKRTVPLADAELNYSPEEWAEALAEDPSCIRAYLEAAEERGRRRGVEEAVQIVRTERDKFLRHANEQAAAGNHVNASVDRYKANACDAVVAALAPRDSGLNAKVGRSESGLPVVNFDRDVLHGKDRK